jgi:hypothetical protein
MRWLSNFYKKKGEGERRKREGRREREVKEGL